MQLSIYIVILNTWRGLSFSRLLLLLRRCLMIGIVIKQGHLLYGVLRTEQGLLIGHPDARSGKIGHLLQIRAGLRNIHHLKLSQRTFLNLVRFWIQTLLHHYFICAEWIA